MRLAPILGLILVLLTVFYGLAFASSTVCVECEAFANAPAANIVYSLDNIQKTLTVTLFYEDPGGSPIDLSRWFLGEISEVRGEAATFYWDMPVEDNGFVWLRTKTGQVAWLHASCTEWKNLFCFEIFGRTGKLQIDGLGGSYGVERLSYYRMLPQMGPPETTIWEYPGEDRSWHHEFAQFTAAIKGGGEVWGDLEDARAALDVVGRVYADVPARARRAG